MYPCTNLSYAPTVSKLFCNFETFLTNGVILEIMQAYVQADPAKIAAIVSNPYESGRPWYQRSNAVKVLKVYSERAEDPYISPAFFKNFELLFDDHSYIITPEFDAFLDDAVAIARVWKGVSDLLIVLTLTKCGFATSSILRPGHHGLDEGPSSRLPLLPFRVH